MIQIADLANVRIAWRRNCHDFTTLPEYLHVIVEGTYFCEEQEYGSVICCFVLRSQDNEKLSYKSNDYSSVQSDVLPVVYLWFLAEQREVSQL